jgi:hypothetical protein
VGRRPSCHPAVKSDLKRQIVEARVVLEVEFCSARVVLEMSLVWPYLRDIWDGKRAFPGIAGEIVLSSRSTSNEKRC